MTARHKLFVVPSVEVGWRPPKKLPKPCCQLCDWRERHLELITFGILVAVDPPATSLTFWGFSGKHRYFQKKISLKIQPNSSQGIAGPFSVSKSDAFKPNNDPQFPCLTVPFTPSIWSLEHKVFVVHPGIPLNSNCPQSFCCTLGFSNQIARCAVISKATPCYLARWAIPIDFQPSLQV